MSADLEAMTDDEVVAKVMRALKKHGLLEIQKGSYSMPPFGVRIAVLRHGHAVIEVHDGSVTARIALMVDDDV